MLGLYIGLHLYFYKMRKISSFLLLTLFSVLGNTQNNKIKDSLEHIVAIAKEDSTKLNALKQLEFQCQDRKEYIAVNKRELVLAKKMKRYDVVANMQSNLGTH
jgi:hypothetical protein